MPYTQKVLEQFILDQAKVLLLEDGGWIRGPDIMARSALRVTNRPAHPGAVLYQWVWERKLFAITHQGIDYFPAFAMNYYPALTPVPGLGDVIDILFANDWALAAWLSVPHATLAGRRPRDLLLEHPDQVIQAAKDTIILRYNRKIA